MKCLLSKAALACTLLAFAAQARAATITTTYNLTLSDAFGTGQFGTVVVTDNEDAQHHLIAGSCAHISVNVTPNFILDTGAHFAFTFSLAGGATVDTTTFNKYDATHSHFSLASGSSFSNAPFGTFTQAIQANCTQGNCGPTLGPLLSFNVKDFAG